MIFLNVFSYQYVLCGKAQFPCSPSPELVGFKLMKSVPGQCHQYRHFRQHWICQIEIESNFFTKIKLPTRSKCKTHKLKTFMFFELLFHSFESLHSWLHPQLMLLFPKETYQGLQNNIVAKAKQNMLQEDFNGWRFCFTGRAN